MIRPIISMWRYASGPAAAGIFTVLLFVAAVSWKMPLSGVVIAVVSCAKVIWDSIKNSSWHWPFLKQIRRFRTASNKRIILHYAPELHGKVNASKFFECCEAEVDSLAVRFGFRLRGRVVVYLFESHLQIGKIFGRHYAGTALFLGKTIVVAHDYCTREVLRHEIGHLFAFRWSLYAPPLLSEGLAVWLQESWGGLPIDKAARQYVDNCNLNLQSLLDPPFFFADRNRNACYPLAGSFTGFLIRRHGWEKYSEIYRKCDGKRFEAKFKKCFGVTLAKAEWQWRNEIIVMEVLKRRLESKLRS